MEYEYLKIENENNIDIVTIEKEKSLNALNTKLLGELKDYFENVSTKAGVYAVILTGKGKAFVAGADISEMVDLDGEGGQKMSELGNAVMTTIENTEVPVVAAVNGFALGGGTELSMACDIRIASQNAKFGQPEVGLGIIPGFGGTQRLQRLVGKGKASHLIFTGDIIDAEEAYSIGLVDKVIEDEGFLDNVKAYVSKFVSKNAPLALRSAKKAIIFGLDVDIDKGTKYEAEAFGDLFNTKDQKSGMKAFLNKEKVKFEGK